MFRIFQVLTVVFVVVAFALSFAHALELPGKMRLDKEAYYTVQPIYYPGFTIGGISEFVGLLATLILLFYTPFGSFEFWLTLIAFAGLVAMQMVYWLITHPVNGFWLKGENLDKFSSGFFSFGTGKSNKENENPPDWTELRNRWEYSHVARAIFAFVSLIALVITISGDK